jgi:predicted nucleotidyltransferase
MDKDSVLELLEDHEKDLKEFGVRRIGLFGSFVRIRALKRVIWIF